MKTTAIAAVGAAMLGTLFCQSADAKRDDYNIDMWRTAKVKQEAKSKTKKPVLQSKKDLKKPVAEGKRVLTGAATKDEASASPAKQATGKLAVKPLSKTKLATAKRKLPSQTRETLKTVLADGLPPFVRADRLRFEQDKKNRIAGMIAAMAPCQKVPVWFALRVAMTESSLNPNVRGSAGEIGLFQLKCSTARLLGFSNSCKALYDARTNIYWGLKHLSLALQSADGDTHYAASKHNGGLGATKLNRDYVKQVMCGSINSGFPSAYQLGASSEVARMCGKRRNPTDTFGKLINDQNLQTASIAAIGPAMAPNAREARLAQASNGCKLEGLTQPAVANVQTNDKLKFVSSRPIKLVQPSEIPAKILNFVRPAFIAVSTKAKLQQAATKPLAPAQPSGSAVTSNGQDQLTTATLRGQVQDPVPMIQANAASQPIAVRIVTMPLQTDAKPQQTGVKQPNGSKTVTFVGQPSGSKSP